MEVKACRIGTEVVIGYSPENKARQIRIDLAKWLSVWPKAKPVLLVVRPDENEAYPAKTEMDGQTMVWTVRSYDTEIPGTGEAWVVIRGEDDEMLGVTPHTSVLIKRGPPNIDGETPPAGSIPWVSDVMDAAQRAEDAAERAEKIADALAGGGGDIDSGLFLPAVTEKDNGKVMTVVDGKWAAAEPPESGVQFETDDTLTLKDGTLSVNTADVVEEGNTLPVTSDAVKRAIDGIDIPKVETFDAEKVYFSDDLTTTTAIGNIELENGQATIPAKGKSLKQVWDSIFVKESNPATTDPSVSLTFSQAKAYEVGTMVTPSYSASLNPGSYTYGPDTGVTASAWSVTDTAGNTARTTASGSFPQLTVSDGISYKITAKATHNAGTIPLTNVGNPYSAGQIKAGTKETTSGAVTGYRNTFYGTVTNKNALTSGTIRGLTKSGKALANGNTFTVTVPVGALRVVIAYPATLRDVTSIKDVNASSAEIKSGFKKSTLNVEGAENYTAISYKVYTLDFANANDTANKFTVQI